MELWDKKLEALRDNYAAKAHERLKELRRHLQQIDRHPERRSTLVSHARSIAHQLYGTAGTYGLFQLSEAMGRAEQLLQQIADRLSQQPHSSLNPTLWSSLHHSLQQAEGEFRESEAAPQASTPSLCSSETKSSVSALCAAEAESPSPGSSSSLSHLPGVPGIPPLSNVSPHETLSNNAESACILVVDDDPLQLEEMKYYAHKTFHQILTATNRHDALQLAQREALDAALIDIHLPTPEEGFALVEKLRALPGKEELPIGFVSADTSTVNRLAAAEANVPLFLSKPLGITDFQFALNQLLSSRHDKRAQVLLLDPSPDYGDWIRSQLSHMELLQLQEPTHLLEVMEVHKPDVLLLNADLPDVNSVDLCRMLRAMPTWHYLPILFLSQTKDLDQRLQCFRAGGDDLLTKPILPKELSTRIEMRLKRARLLRAYADRDALTGLLNRRAMLNALHQRLAEAQRHNKQLSLVILDVDHFKQVNDKHGHLTGDQVLASLGRLLGRRFRTEDLRSRWGGEEFCLAFFDQTAPTTQLILERFLDTFRDFEFVNEHGDLFNVTFSAGIATFPHDGADLESLLRIADANLYGAKQQGRNTITRATADGT